MIKQKIWNGLVDIVGERVELVVPTDPKNGDFSTNAALVGWNKAGEESALSYAKKIAAQIQGHDELREVVEHAEVGGSGFVNLFVKNQALEHYLETRFDKYRDVLKHEHLKELRVSEDLGGKKVMVEYAHPNTHKEMHIGHMRTLIVGESLARLKFAAGAAVFRANYQGDIGPHVAKAVWGMKRLMNEKGISRKVVESFDLTEKAKLLGQAYALGNKHYEDKNEEIDKINSELYQNEGDYLELYERTREWSLEYFESIYHRFHTYFDKFYFESEVWERGKKLVQENTPGVFTESDGAVVYKGEDKGLHTRVFLTSEGNTTYEAKDIGLAFYQQEDFPFDQNIHVVANEQTGYFKVVFAALSEIDSEIAEKELHIPMGFVNLKGAKMSSRTGDVYTVTDLVDKVSAEALALVNNDDLTDNGKNEVSESVAIGAIKYSLLRTGIAQDVMFDVSESVSLDGDSGPYIQYTYARTQSVMRAYQGEQEELGVKRGEFSFDADGLTEAEGEVLRKLIHFDGVVSSAAISNAPNMLCTYLHELAQSYNSFYASDKIVGSERERFRLAVNYVVGEILRHGLYLLGADAPQRM